METFVILIVIAAVIFGVGAAVGADIQDRMAEEQRRRSSQRNREMREAIRQLQGEGSLTCRHELLGTLVLTSNPVRARNGTH